jgi:uncharacterized protein (DUF2249 family)
MRVPDVDDLSAGLSMLKVHDHQPPPTTDEFEQVDQAQLQKDLDIMFEEQARDKLAHVPEIDMPAQLKGPTLFDYQKDGIRWLVHQENSGEAKVPFYSEITYKNGQTAWRCSITRRHQRSPPKRVKGGILADGEKRVTRAKNCNIAWRMAPSSISRLLDFFPFRHGPRENSPGTNGDSLIVCV